MYGWVARSIGRLYTPTVGVFDERIYAEWDALCFSTNPTMPVEERDRRVKALFESCRKDGQWTVSIADAGLVTGHVVGDALIAGRYQDAIEGCLLYFAHPEAMHADEDRYERFGANLGSAQILSGDVETGLQTYLEFIEGVPSRRRERMGMVRYDLTAVFEDLGKGRAPDERLRQFTVELLRGWKALARKATAVLKAKTNGEIQRILESTYSAR